MQRAPRQGRRGASGNAETTKVIDRYDHGKPGIIVARHDLDPKHRPVRDHPDHSVNEAVEIGPGTERTHPQDPGSGRLRAEWRKRAAGASWWSETPGTKQTVGALYKRAWDEQLALVSGW
jgi:hypothetical protein